MIRIQRLLLFFFGGVSLACGCNNPQILPKTDLAFCDFILGGDFNECYEKASLNPIYEGLSMKKDNQLDYASFSSVEIPYYEIPDMTTRVYKGEVESYKGRIFSVRYEASMVNTIIKMYQAKYGAVKPTKREYEEPNFWRRELNDHFVDITYKWLFENGEIVVIEHYQDYRGRKNDYRATVKYIDKKGYEDAEPLLTERLNNQIDSLNREFEKRRLIEETQEREKARIKEEKQKAVLESI